MTRPKVLLVDDDVDEILLTRKSLEKRDCEVVPATGVTDAIRQIVAQRFDVLITDLHMPEPGDGLTVVTAMSHFQPEVLTLVVSNYPALEAALSAILVQADEILAKPFDADQLIPLIEKKRLTSNSSARLARERVASILSRDLDATMERWLSRVDQSQELNALSLLATQRAAYLPAIIRSIIERLITARSIEAAEIPSPAAIAHGRLRYRQGYTAPLMVQESRILQVCLFETLQRNLATVDFASLLPDIMIVADEVDSQLKQSIDSFLVEASSPKH